MRCLAFTDGHTASAGRASLRKGAWPLLLRLAARMLCRALFLALWGVALPVLSAPETVPPPPRTPAALPDLRDLPHDKYGDLVRQGYRIFNNTPEYARRYTGNALSCGNCHLDSGRRPHAAPMWAAWGMYPAY